MLHERFVQQMASTFLFASSPKIAAKHGTKIADGVSHRKNLEASATISVTSLATIFCDVASSQGEELRLLVAYSLLFLSEE